MKHAQGMGVGCEIRLEGNQTPKWIQLIPPGEFVQNGVTNFLDASDAVAVLAKYGRRTNDSVADYEHQTEGERRFDAEGNLIATIPIEAPAAGWIKSVEWRGEDKTTGGLWGLVEWTDRARRLIEAKEYKYFSPVFLYSKVTGHVTEFLRGAITNKPAIDGMVPVTATEAGQTNALEVRTMKKLLEALGLKPEATEEEAVAAATAAITRAGALGKAAEAVGLAADATADTVLTAVATASAGAKESVRLRKALGVEDSMSADQSEGKAIAAAHALKGAGSTAEEISSLRAKIGAIETGQAKATASAMVDGAIQSGKIPPAQKDWAMGYATDNPEGFKAYLASQPSVAGSVPQHSGGGAQPGHHTAEAVAVASKLGLKPEQCSAPAGGQPGGTQ